MEQDLHRLKSRLEVETEIGTFLGDKRIRLLEAIGQHGSINGAAQFVPLSYKAAWDAPDEVARLAMRIHPQTHATDSKRRLRKEKRTTRLWQENLPLEYRALVIAPLDIRHYRDYEIAAERYVGEDEDGKPCFIAHRFGLFEPRSDDGEEFYTVLAYGESLAAWRLRDDRWLIWRKIQNEESGAEARGFYCLSQEMPK